MRLIVILACSAALLGAFGCETVGVARSEGGYAEISPTIANEMMLDSRQIIVLDFRPPQEFAQGHIAGSISTPLDSIETRLPQLLPYQSGTILVYADDEDESARAARLMVAAGFRNVIRIAGGLREWIAGGYQVVTSQ